MATEAIDRNDGTLRTGILATLGEATLGEHVLEAVGLAGGTGP